MLLAQSLAYPSPLQGTYLSTNLPVGLPFPIGTPAQTYDKGTLYWSGTQWQSTPMDFGSAAAVSVISFGADPTGTNDSTAAINAALASGVTNVVIPMGIYLISSPLILNTPRTTVWNYGILQAMSVWAGTTTNFLFSIQPGASFSTLWGMRLDGYYLQGTTGPGVCKADGIEVLAGGVFIWSTNITHFPNTGLALTSTASGDSWVYQPFITQIKNSDFAFGADNSFTADGILVNRADCVVIGGTARWCGIGIHCGNLAGTTNISEHHVYCGISTWVGFGARAARIDPIDVQLEAGANNIWFRDFYLDQGLFNAYTPNFSARNVYVLQTNTSAVFTNATAVQIFANGQNQPYQADYDFQPVGLASNNLPVNAAATELIGYPGFGANNWSGDWTGVAQVTVDNHQRAVGTQGVVRIQHEKQLGGSVFNPAPTIPMNTDYKASGFLQYNYQIGKVVLGSSYPSTSYIANKAAGIIHQVDQLVATSNYGLVTASVTNFTLSSFVLTGTSGQFSCAAAGLLVGQCVYISGAFGGTGSITGYANPTPYLISVTNGSTTGTLTSITGAAIVTTAGTPAGLTYSVSTLVVSARQSGSVEINYYVWGNAGGGITAPCQIASNIGGSSGGTGSYGLNTVGQTVGSGVVYLTIANAPTVTNICVGTTTVRMQNDGAGNLVWVAADTQFWSMTISGTLRPILDQATNLGSTANRINEIFLGSGGGAGTPAIRADNSATTGAKTATFSASNKPGTNNQTTPAQWIPINLDGTIYYVPAFAA